MAVTQLPRRIPRRDEQARAQLEEVAQGARPLVLARDRSVALDGALADLVPGGAVVRGTVLRVAGAPGAGSTTVAFELAAAFTALGEWAAAVDLDATLGLARGGGGRGRARTVRGGPAGSPRPLGHRGGGPARRREPGAGRGAARAAPG